MWQLRATVVVQRRLVDACLYSNAQSVNPKNNSYKCAPPYYILPYCTLQTCTELTIMPFIFLKALVWWFVQIQCYDKLNQNYNCCCRNCSRFYYILLSSVHLCHSFAEAIQFQRCSLMPVLEYMYQSFHKSRRVFIHTTITLLYFNKAPF